MTSLSGPQIIDRNTVLYNRGGTVWRANLADSCPGLTPFSTMIVEVRGSQLCRNDQFRVVDVGMTIPGGFCRFESFTPYERTPQ